MKWYLLIFIIVLTAILILGFIIRDKEVFLESKTINNIIDFTKKISYDLVHGDGEATDVIITTKDSYTKVYNQTDERLSISNDTYSIDMKLTTPKVNHVPLGDDVQVAEIQLKNYTNFDFKKLLEDLRIYDSRTMDEKERREIRLKYLTTETDFDGSEIETWKQFTDGSELGKMEDVKIGLFTNTIYGESIEWIFNISGFELREWASWVADSNFYSGSGKIIMNASNVNPGNTLVVYIAQQAGAIRTYTVNDSVVGSVGWTQAAYNYSATVEAIWYRANHTGGNVSITVVANTGTITFVSAYSEFDLGDTVTVGMTGNRTETVTSNQHSSTDTALNATGSGIVVTSGVLNSAGTECNAGSGFTEVPNPLSNGNYLFQWKNFSGSISNEWGNWSNTGTARIGKSVSLILLGEDAPATPSDEEYPQFTNLIDNNATLIDSGTAWFNVTLGRTNGTVGIQIGTTNYSTTNISTVFNASMTLTSGTYAYYWWGYGNGTSKNYNLTSTRYYTVNSSGDTTDPYFTGIPENLSINYGISVGVGFNATDEVEFSAFAVNNTKFTINNSGWLRNQSALGADTYNLLITINDTSDNTNTTNYKVTVTPIASTTTLSASPVSPIQYANTSNFSCSSENPTTLYINNIDYSVDKGKDVVRSAGSYVISCNSTASQNYTASADQKTYTINKAIPILSISGTTPITFANTSDFAGGESNSGDGGCIYSMDRTNGVYGAGTWTFNYSTAGCINWTAGSTTKDLTVTKATQTLTLTSSPSWSVSSGTETTVTGGNCPSELTCSLRRENSGVSNPDIQTLGEGLYNYTFNSSGTSQNYSYVMITTILNVSDTPDTTGPTFSGITNKSTYVNTSIAYQITATDASGVSCFVVNDSNFNINCSGKLTNATTITFPQLFWLNVTANDSLDNMNSAFFWINTSNIPPLNPSRRIIAILPSINNTIPYIKLGRHLIFQ